MLLGLHVGIRQGPLAALERAESLGAEVLQVLPYRRRPGGAEGFRWEPPDPREAASLRGRLASSGVRRLVAHSRFVPFLASSEESGWRRSADLLARELGFSSALGAAGFVLHLGAYSPGSDAPSGIRRFADGVLAAYSEAGGGPPLVIENVPGGGRRMGGRLEEVAALRDELGRRGMSCEVCLDTAHAWAAGYDPGSADGMDAFLDRAAALFGAPAVTLFHLNDTGSGRGSHREHHEHWGRGALGSDGLRRLLARRDFAGAAGVLEMPPGRDPENLAFVRTLR